MSLLLWFSVCCFLMVDCFVSLSVSCSLRSARILFGPTRGVCILTVNYFVEGRGGVKFILLREGWLKAGERCSNGGSNAPKRGRKASIKYETLRTGYDFSGEDFQNTGTLIVVKSSVFSTSSAYKTHLARDAYHAFWREVRRRQVQFFQWLNFRIKTGAKVVTSDDGISVSDVRKEMHCG